MSARIALSTLAWWLALGCSEPDADHGPGSPGADGGIAGPAAEGGAGAGATAGAGAGDALEVTGSFVLELVAAVAATADRPEKAAYAKVLGQALAGQTPSPTVWTLIAEEGDCRLFEPSVPSCDPRCGSGTVCVDDGECAAYPRGIDLGAVTLRGVRTQAGGDSVVMRPVPPSFNYQLPGGMPLAYPPFGAGDTVSIDVEGSELPAFTIGAGGIDPLQLMGEGDVDVTPDAATELRWEARAGQGGRVGVTVDISHHGGQKGELRCDSDDDGALDVPQALTSRLIELGVAGYPTLEVERYSQGSTSVGRGGVALRIASKITRGVRIPGLVSCDEPGAQDVCPEGQLCQPERLCR